MALVKCPRCGSTVSTFADKCPNCGLLITDEVKDAAVNIADSYDQEDTDDTDSFGFDIPSAGSEGMEDIMPEREEAHEADDPPAAAADETDEKKQIPELFAVTYIGEEPDPEEDIPGMTGTGPDIWQRNKKVISYAILVFSALALLFITIGMLVKSNSREISGIQPSVSAGPSASIAADSDGAVKELSDAFFDRLRDYEIGSYMLKVPEAWEDRRPYIYPEKDGHDRALIFAEEERAAGSAGTGLKAYADRMTDVYKDNHKDSVLLINEQLTINGTEVIHSKIDSKLPESLGIFDLYWFTDIDNGKIATVIFFEGNDSRYDYSDTYPRIIRSLRYMGNGPSPTTSPTAVPSPTPAMSPEASGSPSPSQSPASRPTASPTPRPTQSPTPRPTASPTLRPTPTPTPTPDPTPEPTPTDMPEPTQEPTPEPTPEKTPEPEKTKEPEPDTEP